MRNFNKELDDLFIEWEDESGKNGLTGFCRDGLMLKGEFFQNENAHWGRTEGNENELWYKAEKRILFLMKDTNENPGQDMRTWIGRQHPTRITNRFFKNIALWFYGLITFTKDGHYKSFNEANDVDKYSKSFDDFPLAIVNCKKESGNAGIDNETLLEDANKFGKYLKKQIEILEPNIIVCGGGSGTVLRIAKEIIYPELEFVKINDWIYFNKIKDLILIDAYHPTHRISTKDKYEELMDAYQEYFKINVR